MPIHTDFVGQLVHPNVRAAILELFEKKNLPTTMPWPEGTTISSEERADGYWSHQAKGPWGSTSQITKNPESQLHPEFQEIRWFVRIGEDHNITASGEHYGMENRGELKAELGELPYPVAPFFRNWKEADEAVMSNESYAIAYWFKADLVEWLELRARELLGNDDIEFIPEGRWVPVVVLLGGENDRRSKS